MRIGELAALSGVDVGAIRYYERAGLLSAPAREANGYRRYGDEHLEQLAFVRHCRLLDMPTASIGRLLGFLSRPNAACDGVDHLIGEQLLRVRARMRSLRALERQLAALRSRCVAPQTAARCGILEELVTTARQDAATGQRRNTAP